MFARVEPATVAVSRWLPDALIIVAGLRLMGALLALPAIFFDLGSSASPLSYLQWVSVAESIATPATAGAALIWALRLQYGRSIVALALIMIAAWLGDLLAIPVDGPEWSADFGGMILFALRVMYPVAAITAIVLALRDQRLFLAFALVAVPMTAQILLDVGFVLAAMISGT